MTSGRPRLLALLAPACLAVGAAHASHRQSCDRARAAERTDAGWRHLRAGALRSADSAFASALAVCAADAGAITGRGYVALRENRLSEARRAFVSALARSPDNHDALLGRGFVAWREGDLAAARDAFTHVIRVAPGDSTALSYLARLPVRVDSSALPVRPRPDSLVVVARTANRRFEVRAGSGAWRPFWVKAVNIGAALPGKHPSEFPPDDGTYADWLALCARMGANAVRVYTIHPPHFYKALARWNAAHPDSALWLIHGVWTELPPGRLEDDYDDVAWNREFRAERRRVVDLLHGNAAIQPRAGHAAGLYDTDVSRWVLGYIIGREWEPYSVVAFARRFPARTRFDGRYVSVRGGNALDVWLARFTDAMIAYEVTRYNAQRPTAYTNWPTLDPLTHPTETGRAEEAALLAKRRERPPEASREYDNDAIGLDATRWRATPAFPAGVFASYHAYPYYPDFISLDSAYARARSPWGASNYFGYLQKLVAHHGTMPVVISEYGVPSSRGNAHMQPQGFHHGGHDEHAQAAINARLTREIHAAGAAGAGVFAIIDEWFKKNWLVIGFEQPPERNRLWLNALDAEQNYGVIAMRPGVRDSAIVIDGATADWHARAPWLSSRAASTLSEPLQLRSLHVAHDEGYLYLRLTVGRIDWARARYLIGIDTYNRALGDTRLPYAGARSPVGLEFVVDLQGPERARVLVDEPYALYKYLPIRGASPPATQPVTNTPLRTRKNDNGRYDTLWVTPNRRRLGRDGRVYPAQRYERNALVYARQQETTLADWYADTASGTIEMRIPWGMLHVMDPSSHTVVFGTARDNIPLGKPTDGFRFVVASYDPSAPTSGEWLPRENDGRVAEPPLWTWPAWETPRWYAEIKPQFAAMRAAFRAIPPSGEPRPAAPAR